MDDSLRTQIILAAVNAAGTRDEDEAPAAYEARVSAEARRITVMTGPTSTISRAIESIEKAKVFPAVIDSVKREASSTRGIVTLKAKPSKFHEDGIETVRTERTDNPEGVAMVRALKPLIGHRVLVWVELESVNDGASKVRVLRHVEDLGLARGEAEENAA